MFDLFFISLSLIVIALLQVLYPNAICLPRLGYVYIYIIFMSWYGSAVMVIDLGVFYSCVLHISNL